MNLHVVYCGVPVSIELELILQPDSITSLVNKNLLLLDNQFFFQLFSAEQFKWLSSGVIGIHSASFFGN